MIIPSVQYQQLIQNIKSNTDEKAPALKSKITKSVELDALDKTVKKINSCCVQIQSILSSHQVIQPSNFSPEETLKLQILNSNLMQNKAVFEGLLEKHIGQGVSTKKFDMVV